MRSARAWMKLGAQAVGFLLGACLLMLGRALEPKLPRGRFKSWIVRKVGAV